MEVLAGIFVVVVIVAAVLWIRRDKSPQGKVGSGGGSDDETRPHRR